MFLARSVRAGDFWASEKYPPLFPFLLAPIQALFGLRLIPQKILVLLFAFGCVWMLARLLHRRLGDGEGPWVLALSATLIPVVEYSHYVMSEVPYLFFLLGAVDAADRLLALPSPGRAESPGRGAAASWLSSLRDRRIWLLALWIAAAFYTRSAGVAVGAGILLALLLVRRRAEAFALLAALTVFGLPWLLHALTTPGGNPYFRQLLLLNPYYPEFGPLTPAGLLRRLRDNGSSYLLQQTPVTVLPIHYRSTYSPPAIRDVFYPVWVAVPLLVPFALGLWRGLRRGDAAALTLLLTLGVSCLWPLIWTGSRFLVPVVPLLFLFWWEGWRDLERLGRGLPWKRIRTVLLVALAVLAIRNLVLYKEETRRYPPEWDHYFQALHWIREHTSPDALVIDRKPGFVEFVSGRKALNFPREKDPDRLLRSFVQSGVTHVVMSSLPYDDIGRYLRPAVQARIDDFTPVFQLADPWTYVLEFHPSGSPATTRQGGQPTQER